MLDHTVAEHFPQDVAAELCQCGVDEQVLFLQSLRQRTARSGILFLHSCVFDISCDHLQRFHRFVQLGCRLSDFLRYGSEDDLSRILHVAEVHPVQWCFVASVFRNRHGFQYVPEVETGLYVVRAGNHYVGQIIPSGVLPGVPLATEETLGQNLPRATMEQVYKRITDDLDEALRIFEEIGYDDTGSRTDFDASVAAILRARVALVMEDWGKAVSLADDILAKYTLVSKENYNSGFNRIENVPSLIFGFKMTADNCQTWATWCSQMDPYMSGYAGMWAERPIHSYLYARLNPTDVRRGWWLNKTDNPDPDAATSGYACLLPSNLPNTLASGVKARSEYVSVKFRSYNGDWNNTDLIYMRAEEAVFIKAEAEAHSNIAAAKKTLKDYVTTYRDPGYDITAASLDDVVEEIILQKRIEMWMEGALEWLDRRRLNMPIDRRDDAAMTAAGVANNHIYKAMWEQNESGMRFQLPRSVVIANPEIGEANQNKTN